MANFSLTLFLMALLVIAVSSAPDYKATGQKLIKIKEHDRTKNILIMKKGEVESTNSHESDHSHESSDHSHEASDHSQESPTDASHESSTSSNENSNEDSSTSSSISSAGGHGQSVDGGCVHPHPEPIHIFAKFAKFVVTHRMFIISASSFYADQLSLVLTGKPLSGNNAAKACPRVIWEDDRRRLQGFDRKSILSCSHEDLTDITCHRDDNPDAVLQITYVWSDGRSNVLAIMCGNGRGSWAILSTSREIEKDTEEALLDVVETYGFDPEDNVDFSWTEDDCPSAVQSQYNEGDCVDSDDDLETVPANKKEAVLRLLHHGVYTPLSSYANAFATGMFIRGTPLKSVEDLERACVKDVWSKSGEVERKGFLHDDNFLECDMSDFTRISCLPNEEKADPGANTVIYNKHVHPVWTDGKKYLLTYNCLSTRMKTWSLYSTSKEPVDHDLKNYILSKVADYGFDPNMAYEPKLEQCHK